MADITYIQQPLVTDSNALQQDAFDYIQSNWPEWVPNDSNLESWVIEACAAMVAEARDVASDVPAEIFKWLGSSLLGVTPVADTSATVSSTWTFLTNTGGRIIPQGTLVSIESPDGDPMAFEVMFDVSVAAPTLTTTAGQVTLRAVETGADTSGIGGAGVVVDLIDPLAWVNTVTLTGVTTGGVDAEEDDDYLTRLARRLSLLTPRPITANDYAILATDIAAQNGVELITLSLDNYDPANGLFTNERTVTVVVRDATTGLAVSSGIKTIIKNELQALREVNFVVNVMDPTGPNVIKVTYVGVSTPGRDPVEVKANADAALASYLSSAFWGIEPSGEQSFWRNKTILYHQDISTVLNNVDGFDHWTTLTIGLNAGAMGTTDLTLSGVAPVASPGVITGTVT
jgi:diphthamide synthase (EF-2-diphthine--ammonia ligase)